MRYLYGVGECCCCGRMIGVNPVSVFSYTDDQGNQKPVCGLCISTLPLDRLGKGLPTRATTGRVYMGCDEMIIR